MPSLHFEPTYTSCQIHFSDWAEHAKIYERGEHRAALTWACALPVGERVRVSGGGYLKRSSLSKDYELEGSVLVVPEPVELDGKRTTGILSYYPAREGHGELPGHDAGYLVTLSVVSDLYSRLSALVERKQLPSIIIHLRDEAGLSCGIVPDSQEWDTDAHPRVEILAVNFFYPIIDDDPLLAPPKPEPLLLVQPLLAGILRRQGWILVALAALCLLTWFRK